MIWRLYNSGDNYGWMLDSLIWRRDISRLYKIGLDWLWFFEGDFCLGESFF